MDSDSAQLCRLCSETSNDVLNIWKTLQDATIASVLEKHFWFQIDKNDGMSEWLCQACWIQTETFHEFYKRIENRHCRSNDMIGLDSIKRERSVSPTKEVFESDSNLYEYERIEPLVAITPHFLLCKEENSYEYKDYKVEPVEQSEYSQSSDGKDDNQIQSPSELSIGQKLYNSHSRKENDVLDAQICELFNMRCEICTNVEFVSLLEVRRHYRRVHKVKGYLTCCGKKFWVRRSMLNHVRFHTNPDAYRCDYCGKGFYHKKALKYHITRHIPLDLRTYKCELCSSSFERAVLLKYHVQNKHSSITGEHFPCDKCDKSFRSNFLLAAHNRNLHESSSGHVCDICGRQFKTKTNLKNHIISKHKPQSKVQCNICGAWLNEGRGLRTHIVRQHQEPKDEVFHCPICNKVMKSKSALNHHIPYAHGERRFKCGLCDKEFKVAKNLKEHTALHTGEYLYSCQYCERKFKSNANMYSHRKKAHLAELTRDKSSTSYQKRNL